VPNLISNHIFEQLKTQIRDAIVQNGLSVGDRLPTVSEMAEEYGVSRNTVLRAIRRLVKQGILESRRYHGIVVRNIPKSKPSRQSVLAIGSIHQSGALSKQERSSIIQCMPGWQLFETFIDDENCEDLDGYLDEFLRTHGYDVYILASVSEGVKRYFEQKRITCVVAGGLEEGSSLPNVTTDEHLRYYQGARYLIDCGFPRLAFLQFKYRAPGDYERELGVLEAYNELFTHNNIEKPPVIEFDSNDEAGSKKNIEEFLSKAQFPLGLVSSSGKASCWAMETASQLGISIPDQLGIVGEGARAGELHTIPKITYIRYDHLKMGFALGRLLKEMLQGYDTETRNIKIPFEPPYIIPGGTTPAPNEETEAHRESMLSVHK